MKQVFFIVSFLLLPFVAVFFTATVLHAENTPKSEIEKQIDAIAGYEIDTRKVIGLSIGIAKGDDVLLAKGYGLANVELDVPATANTVYRIGSISKQFTSAAVLLLVDQKVIFLDDPLTKYLPDYPMQKHVVTIRHLLEHTSGVKDFTRLPSYRKEIRNDASQEEVLARFQNEPFDFKPGEKHQYCNSGYFLLGLVVERASNQSFNKFLETRVFKALGLTQTYCDNNSLIIPNRANCYSRWGGFLRNARYVSLKQTVGAGHMAATVGDLLIWQRGLVSHRLLRTESWKDMSTPGKLNNGKPHRYGLGLFIRKLGNHSVIRHGGGISGFRAELAYFPHANAARIVDKIARQLFPKPKAGKATEP